MTSNHRAQDDDDDDDKPTHTHTQFECTTIRQSNETKDREKITLNRHLNLTDQTRLDRDKACIETIDQQQRHHKTDD